MSTKISMLLNVLGSKKGISRVAWGSVGWHKRHVDGNRSCKYRECVPPWRRPRGLPKPKVEVRKTMLRRYVLVIIALTVGSCMDFDTLDAALDADKSIKGTNTTLSVVERAKLLYLFLSIGRAVAANGIARPHIAVER
jgi:hypothetical protein